MIQNDMPGSPAGGAVQTPALGAVSQAADASLTDAINTLRRRRWILVAALVVGVLAGLYRAFTQPQLFEAYGRVQVRSGSSDQYKITGPAGIGPDTMTRMMTESAIIQSDTLLLTVAKDLDLPNNKWFLGGKPPVSHRDIADPQIRQDTLRELQNTLKVTLQPRTDIMRISYSSLDGRMSSAIVNTVISEYRQRSYETRYAASQNISKFLSRQLDDLKQTVETEQEQTLVLGRKVGVLGLDPTHNEIGSSLEDLVKASGQAKLARIVAESRYRMLAGMDPGAIEGSIDALPGAPATGLNTLRGQLATLRASYAEMESTLGPNHPQSKAAKAQIDELAREVGAEQSRLLLQSKETYLIAQENEDKTSAALESEKASADRLRDALVEYTLRQREFESNRTLYESLLQRLRTAGIQAGLESLEIDTVDQAVPPASPTLKPKSSLLLITVAFAMIAGLLVAFLLDALDTTLRSVPEVEGITEMPSLAMIPRAKPTPPDQLARLSAVQASLIVLAQPKSHFTEACRALRTALLLSTAGREPKRIMFTSATPEEGKTTVSSNLACILAQRGSRVLLIDADLRRPSVHHRFSLNGKLGLSTILSGSATLEESIQNVAEVPSLDILASGPVPPFPTELLSSNAMRELLEQADGIYSHIVVDSAPVLAVTDAVLLGGSMDAVMLVVRLGRSSRPVIRRARDLLVRSGIPLKGLVVNAVDLDAHEYVSYYGRAAGGYASVESDADLQGKGGAR